MNDRDAIFIFDGTMLGSSQFHSIVQAYNEAQESVEKLREEKKRRKEWAKGKAQEQVAAAAAKREMEEAEKKQKLDSERSAALIEQLKALKEASLEGLRDIQEKEAAKERHTRSQTSRDTFTSLMMRSVTNSATSTYASHADADADADADGCGC